MAKLKTEIYPDWSDGVMNTVEPDMVPITAYTQGKNIALTAVGPGRGVPMKREGISCFNQTAITGASAVVGIHQFNKINLSTGGFTRYYPTVSDNGRLDDFEPEDSTITTINATAFTSSSTQQYIPDFINANNSCFIVNGAEANRFDGTNLWPIGITAPSSAPTIAGGGAGSHNGTYEAFVTYYNSTTGQESSRGTVSAEATCTDDQFNWTSVPVSSDNQVDTRRLYIRNVNTMANFYLAGTISNNTATTATTSVSDSALTDIGPDEDENDPPPSGIRYGAFHGSRLFLANRYRVYYSKLDMIESFDPEAYEQPDSTDSQQITGLVSMFDVLLIFKTNAVYILIGDDPNTWRIERLAFITGCQSHTSIVKTDSALYWWSPQGPVMWEGADSIPVLIGTSLGDTISDTYLDMSPPSFVSGAYDPKAERVVWSVAQVSAGRNTMLLPWNHRLKRWESDGWDPMDFCTLATITDEEETYIVGGNYAGQIFRLGGGVYTDGITAGNTHSGQFTASGTSVTTITDGTATFQTTGAGLKERKVSVVDSTTGIIVTALATTRARVSSNTATAITLTAAVTGLTDGRVYYYYVGGPAVDFRTAYLHEDIPFVKKRYRFLYLHLRASASLARLRQDFYYTYDENNPETSVVSVTVAASGTEVQPRWRLAHTGTAVSARLRHYNPDSPFTLIKVGLLSEYLSEKLG